MSVATHYLCVVAPGHDAQLERLQRWFADDQQVLIVVERRRVQRRVAATPVDHERRGADRRQRSYVDRLLRLYGWALVKATPVRSSTPTE